MKARIGSIDFSRLEKRQALDYINSSRELHAGGRVITPNMHFFSLIRKNPDLLELVNSHELILCDGVPIVWLSKLARNPIPSRIAGSDFLIEMMNYSSNKKLCVAFVGGRIDTHKRIQERILIEFPGIRHAIYCHAYLPHADSIHDEAEFLEAAGICQPDIFFIGLGFPKQEEISLELFEMFPKSWFLNVGMGIGYLSGEMNRCPSFLQNIGMEWLWRLISEPRRLFRRYILEDLPTFISLLKNTIILERKSE